MVPEAMLRACCCACSSADDQLCPNIVRSSGDYSASSLAEQRQRQNGTTFAACIRARMHSVLTLVSAAAAAVLLLQ
jgi:hypothetical protein